MGNLKKLAIFWGGKGRADLKPTGSPYLAQPKARLGSPNHTQQFIHKATRLMRGQEFTEKFGCGGEDLVYKCVGSDLCWRGGTNPHCGSAHGRAGCKQAVSFFRPLAAQPAR